MGIRLGANATINRNTASYGSPTWDQITIAKDVQIPTSMEEADASCKASLVKMMEPTLMALGVEFDIVEDVGQADYVALRTAFLARSSLDIKLCSNTIATGEYSIRADMKVFKWDRKEDLNGINIISVSLKPCYSTNAVTFAIEP